MLPMLFAVLLQAQADTTVLVRGTVRDPTGRAVNGVEVRSPSYAISTRSNADGRFVLRLPAHYRVRLLVRTPGSQPLDTMLAPHTPGEPIDVAFTLRRLPAALDTLRVYAQAECPIRTMEGFHCRRRSGVGVFRDRSELDPGSAYRLDDLTWGIPGLRRSGDGGLMSTAGWRCLTRFLDGQPETMERRAGIRPEDIVAVEYYANADEVPAWYRGAAFADHTGGRRGTSIAGQRHGWGSAAMPGRRCSLLMFWSTFAIQYDPRLDQSKAVRDARKRRQLLDSVLRSDSVRAGTAPRDTLR